MSKCQRGRPVVYKGNEKRHILGLIRKFGLTGARNVLIEEKVREDGMDPRKVCGGNRTHPEAWPSRHEEGEDGEGRRASRRLKPCVSSPISGADRTTLTPCC
jgi:hypothetical protein